jgi:hypothetical protein
MKRVALAVSLLLVAGEASAISRYDVDNMSCSKVKTILKSEGAAILRYRSKRSGAMLYDRYVQSRSACYGNETTEYASVPTADGSCSVRRCVQIDVSDSR